MEYSTQECLALWLSFLVSYLRAGPLWWSVVHLPSGGWPDIAHGSYTREGYSCHKEDGRPPNNGDARAG